MAEFKADGINKVNSAIFVNHDNKIASARKANINSPTNSFDSADDVQYELAGGFDTSFMSSSGGGY